MNGVRVYMRASWSKEAYGSRSESGDVTVLEYKDAHYEVYGNQRLVILRDEDEVATFPAGDWTGVERF